MIKVYLMGSHAHRTPLSYPEYRKIFQQYVEYVEKPEFADLIILAYIRDTLENSEELALLLNSKSSTKLIVVSEEPLWDTTNSGDFTKKYNTYPVGNYEFNFTALNHLTSSIYDFNEIPYFITTSDEYYVRYSMLFKRNALMSSAELKTVWREASIRAAFFAEKRTLVKKYNVKYPDYDVYGLSIYRSQLAETYKGKGVKRVGQGWRTSFERQALADWHLDKLATLDRNSYMISALENTHQKNYISEKIFDAYATLGIPIYWASKNHAITRIIDQKSFINLFDFEVNQATEVLKNFEKDNDFIDAYRATQTKLANILSSPKKYIDERMQLVERVLKELGDIK